MSIPDALFEQAMDLPEEDRKILGQLLMDSVPPAPEDRDPDWEEYWAAEINRRQALIDSGQAKLLSEKEFMERVRERSARRAVR